MRMRKTIVIIVLLCAQSSFSLCRFRHRHRDKNNVQKNDSVHRKANMHRMVTKRPQLAQKHRDLTPFMRAQHVVSVIQRKFSQKISADNAIEVMGDLEEFVDTVRILEATMEGLDSKMNTLDPSQETSRIYIERELVHVSEQLAMITERLPLHALEGLKQRLEELKRQLTERIEQANRFIETLDTVKDIGNRILETGPKNDSATEMKK